MPGQKFDSLLKKKQFLRGFCKFLGNWRGGGAKDDSGFSIFWPLHELEWLQTSLNTFNGYDPATV